MSKLKILVISAVSLFVIVFVSSYVYISSKVKPEEIRLEAISLLQENFPKAKVELGEIELSLGFSASLTVKKLSLGYQKYNLVAVKDLEIKVPIWSIIKGGGAIDVRMDSPKIDYHVLGKETNWSLASAGKTKKAKVSSTGSKASSKGEVEKKEEEAGTSVPSFLLGSKVNFRLKNSTVKYFLDKKNKGEIEISKFLVKELGLLNPTAFELDSSFKIGEKNNLMSFKLLVIGEFNLNDLISKRDFQGLVNLRLSNVDTGSLGLNIPEVITDLKYKVFKNGAVHADTKIVFKEQNTLSLKIVSEEKNLRLENLLGKFSTQDLAEISGSSIPDVSFNKSKIELKGNIDLKNNKPISPDIQLLLDPAITVTSSGVNIDNKSEIKIVGDSFNIRTESSLLKGKATSTTSFRLDTSKKFQMENIRNLVSVVNLNNIALERDFVRSFVYPKKEESEKRAGSNEKTDISTASAAKKSSKSKSLSPRLPKASVTINLSENTLDGVPVSGKIVVKTGKNVFQVLPSVMKIEKGSLNFSNKVTLKANNSLSGSLSSELKDISFSSFNVFLPKSIEGVAGVCSGKINGSFSKNGDALDKFNFMTNIRARDGLLKHVDISDQVNGAIQNVPLLKKHVDKNKKIKIDPKFEMVKMNARFTSSKHTIKNFLFLGPKSSVKMTAKGDIYPIEVKKEGRLYVELNESGSLNKSLKKIEMSSLPLLLKGKGFDFKADYGYTIKKVAKKGGKKIIKKKAKKVIKKQLDKFLKKDDGKAKDKLKKLFKGFL